MDVSPLSEGSKYVCDTDHGSVVLEADYHFKLANYNVFLCSACMCALGKVEVTSKPRRVMDRKVLFHFIEGLTDGN